MKIRSLLSTLVLAASSFVVAGCAGTHFQDISDRLDGQVDAAVENAANTLGQRVEAAVIKAVSDASPKIIEVVGSAQADPDLIADAVITGVKPIVEAVVPAVQINADGIKKDLGEAIASAVAAAEEDTKEASAQAAKEAVDVVAPFLPQPWGSFASMAAGLVLGLMRASANRKAARRMATAIELQQGDNGTINFDDETTRDNLSAGMGATAKRIVDEAQGKASSLPF